MTVISLSITESTEQIISGIPKTITLSTNIPSTIFYTLDGTTPTTGSIVYIGPITLPTNVNSIKFNAFATNGIDVSAIFSTEYATNIIGLKKAHASLIGYDSGKAQIEFFPFGSDTPTSPIKYGQIAGNIVEAAGGTPIPDGYDADGNPTDGTDLPLSSYQFILSETDAEGKIGTGIGTLPKVLIKTVPAGPVSTSTKTSDAFFNPKAMVIFQDSRDPLPDDVSLLNRAYFSLQNPEKTKNGALLYNSGFDSSSATGTFLRQHYNPRDNTMTYYYRDSDTNQWIISKEPFNNNNSIGSLGKIITSSRNDGIGYVFKWIPFMSRKLL